jgi:hypothetical protein
MVNVLHPIIVHNFNNDEEEQDELCTPTFLKRLKCESENENNKKELGYTP